MVALALSLEEMAGSRQGLFGHPHFLKGGFQLSQSYRLRGCRLLEVVHELELAQPEDLLMEDRNFRSQDVVVHRLPPPRSLPTPDIGTSVQRSGAIVHVHEVGCE